MHNIQMRWLSRSIQGLVIALLVALGTSVFQKPLIDLFGLVAVKAEITAFEWHPSFEQYKPKIARTGNTLKDLANDLQQISEDRKIPADSMYVIRLINGGDKSIEGLKISVPDDGLQENFFELVQDQSRPIKSNSIDVGNIKSGDNKIVRLWGSSMLLNPYLSDRRIRI